MRVVERIDVYPVKSLDGIAVTRAAIVAAGLPDAPPRRRRGAQGASKKIFAPRREESLGRPTTPGYEAGRGPVDN